jgi:hypothetical protein
MAGATAVVKPAATASACVLIYIRYAIYELLLSLSRGREKWE